MKTSIKLQANAKINLCLNVAGKRKDGYHDLEMVMVPLDLHDDLEISIADNDTLTCDEQTLELDASNTIVKAIQLLRDTYHIKEHFSVHLTKRIPMQAGLAGGSADAAAVLRGINELLELHIPLVELSKLSKKIGADVPFCVLNTCSIVKGIGELVEPFVMNCDFHILLVKPQTGVPTGKAFQMLDTARCDHPDAEAVRFCCEKNDFEGLCRKLGNSLEYSAFQILPDVKIIKQQLKQIGFEGVLMSGSGSTVFALTKDHGIIEKACGELLNTYPFVMETRIQDDRIC